MDFREVQRDITLDSLSFPLENGTMDFTGKIDRLDTYTSSDGKILVKISDYKSGNREVSATEAYGGISIQLFLYMDAALEMEEKKTGLEAVPAGVFYVRVNGDPNSVTRSNVAKAGNLMMEPDTGSEDNSDSEIGIDTAYNTVAKDGLINSDYNSQMLLGLEKAPGAGLKPINNENWKALRKNIRDLITEEGNKMARGEINCEPYRSGAKNECEYCPYHSICHFDSDIDGYNYRDLKKVSNFEITAED